MKNFQIKLSAVTLIFFFGPILPQPLAADTEESMDAKDREFMSRLSDAELGQLQDKLRLAMSFYYDSAYAQSLPIFSELAQKAGTLDILYWYATAAQRSGDVDLSIEKYKEILARHENMHNVRLELAKAYFQKGEKELGTKEIEIVKAAAKSSPEAKEKLDLYVAKAGASSGKHHLSLRGSSGILYDDNVGAQPDDAVAYFSAPKEDGGGINLSGSGDYVYDFGMPNDFVWNSHVSLYDLDYLSDSKYDYFQIDTRTGPAYFGKDYRFNLPVGFVDRRYGHSNLSDSWYVNPEISKAMFGEANFNIKLNYRYENETYNSNADQDNITQTYVLGYSVQDKGKETLNQYVFDGILVSSVATVDQYSYTDLGIAPAWYYRDETGMEAYFQIRCINRKYDGNLLIAGLDAPTKRTDNRYTAATMLSKTFDKRYVISGVLSYTHNESNDDRFSFDKFIAGVNAGINWSF